jgi:hypothetical protein
MSIDRPGVETPALRIEPHACGCVVVMLARDPSVITEVYRCEREARFAYSGMTAMADLAAAIRAANRPEGG